MRNVDAQEEDHRASLAASAWSLPLEEAPWSEPSALPKAPFIEPAWDATDGDPAA